MKLKRALVLMAMLSVTLSACGNPSNNKENSESTDNPYSKGKTLSDARITNDNETDEKEEDSTEQSKKREDLLKNPLSKPFVKVDLKGKSDSTITKINEEYMTRALTNDEIQTSLDKVTRDSMKSLIYPIIGKAESEITDIFAKKLTQLWEDGKDVLPKDINDDVENNKLTDYSTKYFANDIDNLIDFLGLQKMQCELDGNYILESTTRENTFAFVLNLVKDNNVVAVVVGDFDRSTETFKFRSLKRTLFGDKYYEEEAKKAPNQQES